MAKRKKPEWKEEEEREAFLYFFTVILTFMFLVGGWFVIQGLTEVSNLQKNFWGIYVAGIGIGLIGLSSFESFYHDRYRVTAMGMLTIIFGYFYAVFAVEPEIPDIAKGVLFIILGAIGGTYVYYLNEYGWELVEGQKRRYVGLLILVTIFLVMWALFANAYPEAFSEAAAA